MLSATIIYGGIGTGKTTIANALAATHPNMKVHEVSSMADVRGVAVVNEGKDYHPVFVCGNNFLFAANDLANALRKPVNYIKVFYIVTH
jgi:guanylate kinase